MTDRYEVRAGLVAADVERGIRACAERLAELLTLAARAAELP
jgi:hypothetical protein